MTSQPAAMRASIVSKQSSTLAVYHKAVRPNLALTKKKSLDENDRSVISTSQILEVDHVNEDLKSS